MVAVGRGEDAARYFQQSLDIRSWLAGSEPDRADYQRDLSISYERLGDLMEKTHDLDEAIRLYELSVPLARALAENQQDHAQLQRDLSITLNRMADLYHVASRHQEATRYRMLAEAQDEKIEKSSGVHATVSMSIQSVEAGEP